MARRWRGALDGPETYGSARIVHRIRGEATEGGRRGWSKSVLLTV